MSSISVSSLVLGSLTVEVDGSDSTLALSVLSTAPASLTIELGTPGAQGDAATIAVGTTTTLAPGSSATVANVGTSSAAVFNFGIPAGQTGATGATGPGVPIGGTDGMVLAKIDATNYNTQWVTPFALQVRNQVRNETGAQLDKGTVVYVNGAAGNKVTVTKAQANTDATSAQTFAVLLEDIPNNQNGYAVTSGLLENLDTSAFAAGTQVYLSPTVAGTYTSTKPSAPNHLVYVGVIERSHVNQGTMLVRIQNGYELDELHDVAIASKTNNDLLAYESATNLWKNKSYSTLGLLTSATAASTYYLQTNPAGYIDATALAPYLTIASAAVTYQTTAGMSAYLTTATAASTYLTQANAATTYYPLSGNPSGFITSSALTPYLTSATAASTYQTLAGMSSYLATANNLSELTATASTARTNLGLGTAAVEPATKLVPSGGTTGQVLTKSSNADWDDAWTTISAGGGGVDIQVFGSPTTSGSFTWTKPANAKMVYVWMVGGGSGGGSGARRATTSIRGGGGGGGGGNAYATWINAAYLGATETVTVGTGVAGAPPVTVDNTNGTATASSTTVHSQFGGYRTYGNYGGGAGGTSTAGGNGSNTGNHIVDYGTIANVIAVTGLNGATTDNYNQGTSYHAGKTACGGGGGAGAPANVTVSAVGGFGAQIGAFSSLTGPGRTTAIAGGTRGNFMPVTLPGNGVNGGFSSSFNSFTAGTGGGGGAYITATAGQTGGNGGWPGGGGGGGSASDNGFNSGGGGNGANGIVVVITYS